MRQVYDTSFLTYLLHNFYDEWDLIASPELFTSWFENSNYFLETDQWKYVMKLFEGEWVDHDIVVFECRVMKEAHMRWVTTPDVIRLRSWDICWLHEWKSFVLMNFVSWENRESGVLSHKLCYEVWAELAKLACALEDFTDESYVRKEYEFDQKHFLLLRDTISYLPDDFDNALFQSLLDEFSMKKELFDSLPRWLIHNDAVPHNILANDEGLTALIDFWDMNFSPYVQDIAVSLWGFAQDFETKRCNGYQVKVFMKWYLSQRDLSDDEFDMIYLLVQCRLATVILAFSRRNVELWEDKQRSDFIRWYYNFLLVLQKLGKETFDGYLWREENW